MSAPLPSIWALGLAAQRLTGSGASYGEPTARPDPLAPLRREIEDFYEHRAENPNVSPILAVIRNPALRHTMHAPAKATPATDRAAYVRADGTPGKQLTSRQADAYRARAQKS